MRKKDYIQISPSYFQNNFGDGFCFEIPEQDFSNAKTKCHPYLIESSPSLIVGVFRGANLSKLKYVYNYIYQSPKTGIWRCDICLSDLLLPSYIDKVVTTDEEVKQRHKELVERVVALNHNKKDLTDLPIEDFVRKHISEIDTTRKLALFITKLMKTVFSDNHFVTEKQLLYYSTPKTDHRYKTFQIRKRNGGLRVINSPSLRLNKILHILNVIFKTLYTPNEAVMGFSEGKSIVDNALRHIGQNYVFNIDLKDFFTSIPQARIWARIQCPPFNFPRTIANVVAGLCCVNDAELGKNVLPQGAPTSPLLTNAICDKLDKKLCALSKRYGLHYSRYADDISFSSMHNVYQQDSLFIKELKGIVEDQGFCLNDKKTRLLKSGQHQEVTGLTVNSKVNVSRKYIRDLRCLLHIWETKGYTAAYSYFYPIYKKEKGYIKKGEPVMENVIGGKLNYLRMIKGSGNDCYKKLLQRFEKLQQIIYVDDSTDKGNKYVFVQSYLLSDFETYFDTKITLQVSAKNNLIGKCIICNTNKTIPIHKQTQEILCPYYKQLIVGDEVASDLLKDCYVTLCRQKGKNFWLITREPLQRSKCLSINDIIIDTDNFFHLWKNEGFVVVVKLFQLVLNKNGVYDTKNIVDFINDISRRNETAKGKKLGKKRKLEIENALEDDFFKTVTEQEIQEFIFFVTHFKQFTYKQKKLIDRLLTRDIAQRHLNMQEFKPMSVSYTANFFANFNKPDGLKYLTHDFDSDSNITLPDLKKQSFVLLQEHKDNIPESLYKLIYSYIAGKVWKDALGADNSTSIFDKSLINWSKANGNAHPITNPDFANGIYAFKNAIRIVPPSLQTLVDVICSKLELNVVTIKLNKADFYTNTFILNRVLDRILQMMKRRIEQYPNIEISLHREIVDDRVYKQIFIIQRDSCPENPFEDVSIRLNKDTEAGDLGTIRKILNGYCLWSIETKWDGKPLRWNILRNEDSPETEPIKDNEVVGFKHILTFM